MSGQHDHDDHPHPHVHGPLESIGHVHGGAAALNIGGDVGALNVALDAALAGTELHLRSEDPSFAVHTGVWTRHAVSGDVTTALFCELTAGTYWVLAADGTDVCPVEVEGGAVAEVDLRTAAAPDLDLRVIRT